MKRSMMKRFWYDEYFGGFNWALVAVIAFVGIFLFNVITAEVVLPKEPEATSSPKENQGKQEIRDKDDNVKLLTLPDDENKLRI